MPIAPALRGRSIRSEPDVKLLGEDGVTDEIHSVLLMTLSPYFQIVLSHKEADAPVRIDGADRETLTMLKEYAYEGKITGLSLENYAKIFKVADMYNIMGILGELGVFEKKHHLNQVSP